MLDVAVCASVPLGEWKVGGPTHLHEFISGLSDYAHVDAYVPYVAEGYTGEGPHIHQTHSQYSNALLNTYHFSSRAQLALIGSKHDIVYWRLGLAQGLRLLRLSGGIKIAEINSPLLEERALTGRMQGLVRRAARWDLMKNLHKFDRFITVSDDLKTLYNKKYGVPAENIDVVYSGVNPGLFNAGRYRKEAAELKKMLGIADKQIIGYAGSLRPWHGIQHAVHMMSGLKNKDAVLCVVGGGSELNGLRALAASLGLSDRVCFTGDVPYINVPAYMEMFDIALAPYSSYGVSNYVDPLKLFEYMAMGKPIVCGSTSWAMTVLGGDCGAIVDCEDYQRFAARVDELLDNCYLSAFIASNAIKKALKNYTSEVKVKKMLDIYKNAHN